jgi:hypothetical protein
MRGDQLVRQWRIIRAMEASPKGLIVAEIATRDGAQGALQIKTPSKACSKNWNGLFCYGGAEANSLSNTFLNGRA